LADDRPSSCNECHLSGIDLSIFVGDTPCATMACMIEQDMVDLESPEHSRILSWIRRADPASPLITPEVIDQEYEGVLEWIEFNAACGSAACGNAVCQKPQDPFCETVAEPELEEFLAQPAAEDCSDKAIEQYFLDNVYRTRGRCYPCHFDSWDRNTIGSPVWIHTGGTCNQASLATLREIERKGYIDLDHPERSLLLEKPLALRVEHGGATKFHESDDDYAYLSFKRFVEHYASCKGRPHDGGRHFIDATAGDGG
jgi:hypothetical protein